MIKKAEDDILIKLAEHVDNQDRIIPRPPTFWREDTVRIFISHISKYKKEAAALQNELTHYKCSAFVAHEDIVPTLEWQTEIETALRTMDALVALITPEFDTSKWTDQEIGFALGRSINIIPVRLGLDPYGFIGKTQGLQGEGKKNSEIAAEIIIILINKGFNSLDSAQPDVDTFVNSWSYADAKKHIGILEKYNKLSNKSLQAIEKALADNPQISNSFGVPERVKALLARNKK